MLTVMSKFVKKLWHLLRLCYVHNLYATKGQWFDGNTKTYHLSYYFFPLFRACVKTEAATLLTAFEVLGLLNNFEALEATDFEVDSFLCLLIVIKIIWLKI